METEGLSVDQSAVQLVGEEIFGFGNGQCSAGENSRRVFLIANPTADTRVVVIVLPHAVGVIIVVDIEIVIGGELGKVVGSVHTARFHIGNDGIEGIFFRIEFGGLCICIASSVLVNAEFALQMVGGSVDD